MQAMTAAWLPAYAADEIVVVQFAELWSGLNGSYLGTLLVDGGQVVDDWTNANRRAVHSLSMPDPTGALTPFVSADPLYPDGPEVRVYSGLAYAGGAMRALLDADKSITAILNQPYTPALGAANGFECALLGTFLMETCRPSDRGSDYSITIEGTDRSARVQRARFTQPYATNGTDTLDVCIQKLVNFLVPNLSYSLAPSTYVPPVAAYNVGDDGWAAAQKLAADGGYKLDFGPSGSLTMYAVVDPSLVTPVLSLVEGAGCTMTSLDRPLSNKNVPNWIIAIASGSGIATPIRADWQDLDPQSPTYIGGSYPTTVETIRTSSATTLAQVQAIANAQGALNKGKIEQVAVSLIGNAALTAGDVLRVTRARAGVRGSAFVFDRFTHTLGTGAALAGTGRLVA